MPLLASIARGAPALRANRMPANDAGLPSVEPSVKSTRNDNELLAFSALPRRTYGVLAAFGATALSTFVSDRLFGRGLTPDVAMTYLLGVVLVSALFDRFAAILATALSVLAFDYFFIPPYLSFRVSEFRNYGTLCIMTTIALLTSGLMQRLRAQAAASARQARITATVYAMTRELADATEVSAVLKLTVKHLRQVFGAAVAVILIGGDGTLAGSQFMEATYTLDADALDEAETILHHGVGSRATRADRTHWVRLVTAGTELGVLGVRGRALGGAGAADATALLNSMAAQTASAVQRVRNALAAQSAEREAELERLHSSLLSSISHDLRGPLAVIIGSTSAALDDEALLSADARNELIASARGEAERMNQLIEHLVQSTRLASGSLQAQRTWYLIQDVISQAVTRLRPALRARVVRVAVDEDVPPVSIDPVLMEQVFVNLLENVVKYAPEGEIDIAAHVNHGARTLELEVADRGPGIPASEREQVFEKFIRLHRESPPGAGLGLAICRGIVATHGGRIWVTQRPGGGALFRISLPLSADALAPEDERP